MIINFLKTEGQPSTDHPYTQSIQLMNNWELVSALKIDSYFF